MNQKQVEKLNQLFNQFAKETRASSFAVSNLLNRTVRIIRAGEAENAKNINEDLEQD